jgi:hypothetical protein
VSGPGELDLKRKWLAIALATLVMTVSYWLVLFARAAGSTENAPPPTPPFALGMMLVPFAFMALAFLSREDDASWAVLKGMGLFLVFGLPLGLFNVVIGLVAGYGLGAVVTLRREPGIHGRRPRVIAVLLAVVYTVAMLAFIPEFGVFTGSVIPFVAVGIADQVVEGRLFDQLAGSEEETSVEGDTTDLDDGVSNGLGASADS